MAYGDVGSAQEAGGSALSSPLAPYSDDDFWSQWLAQRQQSIADPGAFYRLLQQTQPTPAPSPSVNRLIPSRPQGFAMPNSVGNQPQQAGSRPGGGLDWLTQFLPDPRKAITAPLPWDTQKALGNQSQLGYTVQPLSKVHNPLDLLTAIPETIGRGLGAATEQTLGRAVNLMPTPSPVPAMNFISQKMSDVNRLIPGYGGKFQEEHPGIETLLQQLETAGLTKGLGKVGGARLPAGLAGQRGEILPQPLKPTPDEMAKLGRLAESPLKQVKQRAQIAIQYLNQNKQLRPEDRSWLSPPPEPAAPEIPQVAKHTTGMEHGRIGFDVNASHTPEYLDRFAQERAMINGEKGDAGKGTPLTFHGIPGRYQVAVNGQIVPASEAGMPRFNAEHLADHLKASNAGKVRVIGQNKQGMAQLDYENQLRLKGQRGQLGGEEPQPPELPHSEAYLTPQALRNHVTGQHWDELPPETKVGLQRVEMRQALGHEAIHDELLSLHDQLHAGDFKPEDAPIGFDETPPVSGQLNKIVPPGMVYGPAGLERAVARPQEPPVPAPEDLGDYVRRHPSDQNAVKILLDQAETLGRPLTLDEMQALRQAEQLQGQIPIPNEDLAAFNRMINLEGGATFGEGSWGRELVDPQRINDELPKVGRGGPLLAMHGNREGEPPLFQANLSQVGEKPPPLQPVPPEGGGPPVSPPPPATGTPPAGVPPLPPTVYDHPIVKSVTGILNQVNQGYDGFGDLVVGATRGLRGMVRREATKQMLPAILKEAPLEAERLAASDVIEGKAPATALKPETQRLVQAIQVGLNRLADQAMNVDNLLKGVRDNYLPQVIKGWTDPTTRIHYSPKDIEFQNALNAYNPKMTNYDRFFMRRMNNDLAAQGFELERDIARLIPAYFDAYGKAIRNQQIVSRALAAVMQSDGRKAAITPADVEALGGETRVGTLPGTYADYKPVSNVPGIAWIHPGMVRSMEPLFNPKRISAAESAATKLDSIYRSTAMLLPTIHGLNQIAHQLLIPGQGRIPIMGAIKGHDIMADAARRTEAERYVTQANPHDELMQIQGKMGIVTDPNWWQSIHGALESSLWDHIVTAGQFFAYEQFRNKFMADLKKYGFTSPEEARIAAGKMADITVGAKELSGNERGLTYLLFAYRWTENHLAIPAMSIPKLGEKVALKRHADITPEIARTLSSETGSGFAKAILVTGLYTEIMNYMLGGQSSLDNSDGHRFDISVKNITGQDDYIENPMGRFLNFYLQIMNSWQQGGLSVGTAAAIANRLMPPFSTLLQAKELVGDAPPNQAARVLSSFIPDPARPFSPAGQALTQGKLPQAGLAAITGLLGQSKGVMSGPSQGPLTPGVMHERAVDAELASRGQGPATATLQQRQDAEAAVNDIRRTDLWSNLPIAREIQPYLPTGLPGMDITKAQIDRFRQIQTNALVQAGIPEDVQERLRNAQQSPMALLNSLQKRQIFQQHPELELYSQITPITHDAQAAVQDQQTISYHAGLGQAIDQANSQLEQLSARFAAGQLDQFAWRDQRRQILDRLWGANGAQETLAREYQDAVLTPEQRAAFQQKFHLEPTAGRPEDLAYEAYQKISLDDPKYTDANGDQDALGWQADRQNLLSGFPADVQTYIHMRQEANRTPMEGVYQDAIAKYSAWLAQQPDLAQAYHELYSKTSNPLQRKVLENQTPGLKLFLKQRLQFLQSDPQLAFWLLHGTAQGKALTRAGVSPTATPAASFQQLYPGVDITAGPQGSNLPPISDTQLAQELRQYIGVP